MSAEAPEPYKGLYIAMHVVPTPGLEDLIGRIPRQYGSPIDPATAHVTLSSPEACVVSGMKSRDESRWERVRGNVEERLGKLGLEGGLVFSPDLRFRFFGGFIGVSIVPGVVFQRAIGAASDILEEEFGEPLMQRQRLHMRMARRIKRGSSGELGDTHQLPLLPFPTGFVVQHFRVEVDKAHRNPYRPGDQNQATIAA